MIVRWNLELNNISRECLLLNEVLAVDFVSNLYALCVWWHSVDHLLDVLFKDKLLVLRDVLHVHLSRYDIS
jgi:hypothetical protein